ncbi:MAG: D-alanine--D-alanine ligase [Spirochaetales bacterium]|nr:D-alanine--D-alanine ligase [Spirochaetales bacterium]
MITVAVLFGGRSAEHEVSLQSAVNVVNSMDRDRFNPVLIGIDKQGKWYLNDRSLHLLNQDSPGTIALASGQTEIALIANGPSGMLMPLCPEERDIELPRKIDALFPVLHGPYGEDGTVQGLARLADLPCVGAGVLGSAVGMDKDVMKRLLRDAGVLVSPFVTLYSSTRQDWTYEKVCQTLDLDPAAGSDLYVKPANMGSSVGISRVCSEDDLRAAVETAFSYDTKIIIEAGIKGRELECAVLGNDEPKASEIGEIVPADGFYSYKAKYIDADGAALIIPAPLASHQSDALKEAALKTYRALCCRGMGRVDMFLTPGDQVYVNEINTLPGFTNISMYPKLWEHSGLSQKNLISRLIDLAIEDFETRKSLKVDAR